MKRNIYSNIFLTVLLVVFNSSQAQESFEGLFYLDNTPVSITIKDKKISELSRLEELSEGNHKDLYCSGVYRYPD